MSRCADDGLLYREREVVRTAIYLWRNMNFSHLEKLKELNHVQIYLWYTEEELTGISLGYLP